MDNKKDIGSFLKEQLTQLDRVPSDTVWERIEHDLNQKKKKRRAFLWLFFASVPLGILFSSLAINNLYFASKPSTTNQIKTNTTQQSTPVLSSSKTQHKNTEEDKYFQDELKTEININKSPKSKISTKNNIALNSNQKPSTKTFFNQSKKKNVDKTSSLIKVKNKTNSSNFTLTESIKESNFSPFDKSILTENTSSIDSVITTSAETAIAEKDTLKTTIKRNPKKEKDSTQTTEKNQLKRLLVSPYFGSTFSRKIGSKNPLLPNTTLLNQSSKTTFNFGILGRWMATERLGLQTGIGLLQLQREIQIENNNPFFLSTSTIALELPSPTIYAWVQNDDQVKLKEEYRYIEVPVEVYYIWSEKKLGLASSLGFSMLFLTTNNVYLESPSLASLKIGSNSGLSQQSITANAKLNVFYPLSKKIQIDFYPEIQFHLMSNRNQADTIPYYISFKTGISYKL